MQIGISVVILAAFAAWGCNSHSATAELRENCALSLPHWQKRSVEPPSLVKVWNVTVRRDDVELDGTLTQDDTALKAIEATSDFDPGAYVVLNRGGAHCDRVEALARQISERFNCAENYCYFDPPPR